MCFFNCPSLENVVISKCCKLMLFATFLKMHFCLEMSQCMNNLSWFAIQCTSRQQQQLPASQWVYNTTRPYMPCVFAFSRRRTLLAYFLTLNTFMQIKMRRRCRLFFPLNRTSVCSFMNYGIAFATLLSLVVITPACVKKAQLYRVCYSQHKPSSQNIQ